MKRALLRLLGIVILLGQFVQVTGGLACARSHRQQPSCHDTTPAGPAFTVAQDTAAQPCNLGPCLAPAPAVATVLAAPSVASLARPMLSIAPTTPVSITRAPIPPPPQA